MKRNRKQLAKFLATFTWFMLFFFWPIRRQRWPPGVCLAETFHFLLFLCIPQLILTTLDRNQVRDVFYLVLCLVDPSTKMAVPASDWLRHFRLPSTTLERILLQEALLQVLTSLAKFVFFVCRSLNKGSLWLAEILFGTFFFTFLIL